MNVSKWYIAQVKTNAYRLALENLTRQGFGVFHPMHKVTGRIGNIFKEKFQPLFPGYLFFREREKSSPISKVNSTRGLIRVISSDGKPRQIPNPFIESLMARCDANGVLVKHSTKKFCVGEQVRITSGPFADCIAQIEKIDEKKRVWVLLQMAENFKPVVLSDLHITEV